MFIPILLITLILTFVSINAKFVTNNANAYCYISSTTPIDKNMIAALGSSDKINTIVNNIIKKHSLRANPQAESIKNCLEAKQKEQEELKKKEAIQQQEYAKKRLRSFNIVKNVVKNVVKKK